MPTHMAFVKGLLYGVCLLSSFLDCCGFSAASHSPFEGQEEHHLSFNREPHPSTRPLTTNCEKTRVEEPLEMSVTHSVNMFVESANFIGADSQSLNSRESSSAFGTSATTCDGGGDGDGGGGGGDTGGSGDSCGGGGGRDGSGDGGSGEGCDGGGCSDCGDSCGDGGAAGYQLVPYKPNPVLSVFHEVKRSFKFAGKEWNIHQQWNDVGLASVVWEAALLLSSYLEVLGEPVLKGRRVIELGAGTGLVGFVASSLGAESVLITDKNTVPAKANLQANQNNLLEKDISVAQFEWGTDPSRLNPPFDVVVAADVIYIEDTYPLLLKSLVELSNSETVILISCKRRYERDDRFFDLLRESGRFSFSVVWRWPKDDPNQQENDVKVYKVRLVS